MLVLTFPIYTVVNLNQMNFKRGHNSKEGQEDVPKLTVGVSNIKHGLKLHF